jgi:hypothetical protein
MRNKYIEECKNFKWLQENFKNYDSGKPNNGQEYVDGILVQVPHLDTLIELLGMKEFAKVVQYLYFYDMKDKQFLPAIHTVIDNVDDLKLACLMALKKIKGEEFSKKLKSTPQGKEEDES